MIIEKKVLTPQQAFAWVRERGLPGVPTDDDQLGASLEMESHSSLTSSCLFHEFGEIAVYTRRGIALVDGGYYINRDGVCTQVFLVDPESSYPFEGLHDARRFTADGRYCRLLTDNWWGIEDLISAADPAEIKSFEMANAGAPTLDDYRDAGERLRTMIRDAKIVDASSDKATDFVEAVIRSAHSPAIARAGAAYLETNRINDDERSATIVRTLVDHNELRVARLKSDLLDFGSRNAPLFLCIVIMMVLTVPALYPRIMDAAAMTPARATAAFLSMLGLGALINWAAKKWAQRGQEAHSLKLQQATSKVPALYQDTEDATAAIQVVTSK